MTEPTKRPDRTAPPIAWSVCGASVIGSAHTRLAQANQDAYECRLTPDGAVAVVADGHGAARHPRSGAGARLAAHILCDVACEAAGAGGAPATEDDIRHLVEVFHSRWRDEISRHSRQQPLQREELTVIASHAGGVSGPGGGDPVPTAYGTTVLALWFTADLLIAFGIGDGELGYVDARGGHHPLCPAPPTVGVVTDSLGSAEPLRALRTDLRPIADAWAGWACTDGFSQAQADPTWRDLVARQLHDLARTRDFGDIARDLPTWLEPAAATGGDDTTMVLVLQDRRGDVLGRLEGGFSDAE